MEQHLQSRDEVLATLKSHLRHTQEQMKKFAAIHHWDVVFDKVYLKIQQSLARKQCEKLSPKYFGPYEIY